MVIAKAKVPSNLNPHMGATTLAIKTGVQITSIIALGVIVVVGLLKNYNVKLRYGDSELVLEKK